MLAKSIFLKVNADKISLSFDEDGTNSLSRRESILVSPETKCATSLPKCCAISSIETSVSSTTS